MRAFNRRLGGAGMRRGIRGVPFGGVRFLLNYLLALFVRATEAAFVDSRLPANGGLAAGVWAFLASAAAAWKGVNVARIAPDGAALLEGARENQVTESADASTWGKTGTGTETPGQTAPDGSTDAWRVGDTDAAAKTTYTQTLTALAIGTHAYSIYLEKDTDVSRFPELEIFVGSAVLTGGTISVQVNTSTGATATRTGTPTSVTVFDAGAEWRVVVIFAITTGGTAGTRFSPAAGTVLGVLNVAATGAATPWGIQVELGAFVSSPIRTSGAAVTRALDDLVALEADIDPRLFSVGYEFDWWPMNDSSADATGGGNTALLNAGPIIGRNRILFDPSGGISKLSYRSVTAATVSTGSFAWAIGDKVTVRVAQGVEMECSVNGVSKTTASLAALAPWASGDLRVGALADDQTPAFGVFSRIRAL